jgi:hypothetical protein
MKIIKENILREIFPEAGEFGRGGNEINGLSKDTIPQNCTILKTTPSPWQDRRTFYCLVYNHPEFKIAIDLRICKTMAGSVFSEFVVIHNFEEIDIETNNEKILKESYAFRISEC